MDYHFSEEQALLRDSLRGWLARNYPFDQWRKLIAAAPPYSDANWRSYAEMGWIGIGIPETYGGMGLGAFERMIIGEAFGYRLVTEPYLSSVMLAGGLLARAGDEAQKRMWLTRIAEGETKMSFAFAEKSSRFSLNRVETRAEKTASGYMLTGEKILVLDARGADRLIVLARTSGGPDAEAGLSLFLVDPKSAGVDLRAYATVDDRGAADVRFDSVIAEDIVGEEGGSFPAVEAATDEAIAFLCAEGVGAMQALFDLTLAYVKTRKQFGQAIGDFQVIQHNMVELRIQIECARALTVHAAAQVSADRDQRARAASAAKAQVGRSARVVGRTAVQLHGGMGMTNEMSVGQYFKRLLMVETLLGDIEFHQKRFASLPSDLA